jgi:hypothetical protein
MKLHHAYILLACFAASPVLAQASASVAAGDLSGKTQAGPPTIRPTERPLERQVARGPRTDDTADCDKRGVTVHSGNGSSSASASVSNSPGGASAVAGGGSPGSRVEYFGCEADKKRSQR